MKRLYDAVTVFQQADGQYEIHLDGKPVKLLSDVVLSAPNAAIAHGMQREWAAQEQTIKPDTMPVTQILTTARGNLPSRDVITQAVLPYLDTDLLCYRAAAPPEIAARQAELWDPWLDWFAQKFGARLATTEGLAALQQPVAAHQGAAAMVGGLDDLSFTLFQLTVAATASLVLGAAFIAGAANPEQLYAAMHAEENFKAEIYKADRHGFAPHEEKARAATLAELQAAAFIRDNR